MAASGVIEKVYDKAIRRQFAEAEARQALLANTRPTDPELIKQVATEVLQLVKEGLMRDGIVRIHNFGTFRLKMAKARGGYNPYSREKIRITARPRVVFTPAKALRERIQPQPVPIIKLDKHHQITGPADTPPVPVNTPAGDRGNHSPGPSEQQERNYNRKEEINHNRTTYSPRTSQSGKPATRHTQAVHNEMVEKDKAGLNNDEILYKRMPAAEKKKPVIGSSQTPSAGYRNWNDKQAGYRRWAVIAVVLSFIGLMIWLYPHYKTGLLPDTGDAVSAQPAMGGPAVEQEPRIEAAPITDGITGTEPETIPEQVPVADNIPSMTAKQFTAPADADGEIAPGVSAGEITGDDTADPLPAMKTAFFNQTEYAITEGDSLWRLAKRFYENPYFWPHIYHSNHDSIKNPNRIEANDLITLPELIGPPGDLTAQDRHRIAQGYFLLYEYYKKVSYEHPHHALLGVKWFDEEVLRQNHDRIETIDEQKLHAKRKDNELIMAAFSENSKRTIK